YGFFAAILPVWLLLAPRDYLSTFMKVGTIVMLAVAIIIVRPVISAPPLSEFAHRVDGPVWAGPLFPFLFVTIACGALSGFHALISSGTTPKLLEKEGQTRLIGYGGMLTESFVAIMALITAAIINQHLYFVINSPGAATGPTAATAATYANGWASRAPRSPHKRSPPPPPTSVSTRSSPVPAAHRHWRWACPKYCTRCSAART